MSYAALAQSVEAGKHRFREGHYHEAEQCFLTALQETEAYPPPNAYHAQQLKLLGVFYFAVGQFEKAVDFLQRSLALERNLYGLSDLVVCKSLDHLGLVYHLNGQYAPAVRAYEEALAIVRKAPFQKLPQVDSKLHYLTLHLLAMAHCAQGEPEKAAALCRTAAEEIGETTGPARDMIMDLHGVVVRYCGQDANADSEAACQWLLRRFSEQLQKETLGAVVQEGYRAPQPRGDLKGVHDLLSLCDDVWRPGIISRDEIPSTNQVIPRSSSPPVENRLAAPAEDSWRP
ncbi:MAG TPA: tetratricopeptide repeat protein [bacterium]|nr:tetratricopeptide repeat protein [bacterium]